MNLTERAIQVALEAHRGQLDREGRPYILHPLHVMMQMDTEDERIAAVLHDVIEDSALTLADLRAEGFPEAALEAVDLMTHREEDSYGQYVRKLKPNPIARKIKMADLQHNMDIRRLGRLEPKDLERLQKYRNAWKILTEDHS